LSKTELKTHSPACDRQRSGARDKDLINQINLISSVIAFASFSNIPGFNHIMPCHPVSTVMVVGNPNSFRNSRYPFPDNFPMTRDEFRRRWRWWWRSKDDRGRIAMGIGVMEDQAP
jgi:hypothetical protein